MFRRRFYVVMSPDDAGGGGGEADAGAGVADAGGGDVAVDDGSGDLGNGVELLTGNSIDANNIESDELPADEEVTDPDALPPDAEAAPADEQTTLEPEAPAAPAKPVDAATALVQALPQILQQQAAANMQAVTQALAPILQPMMQQQQAFQNILAQNAQRQAQEQFRASMPQEPGPDASISDHLKYAQQSAAWQSEQVQRQAENQLKQLDARLTQTLQALENERLQATRQRTESAFSGEVQQTLTANPERYGWLQDPERFAGVRLMYNTYAQDHAQRGVNPPAFRDVADMFIKIYGVPAARQATQNAQRRNAQTAALKTQRATVKGKVQGAIPAAATGRAGAPGKKPDAIREGYEFMKRMGVSPGPEFERQYGGKLN